MGSSRRLLTINRTLFHNEMRSRIHFLFQSLREHKPTNSFYNLVINTPEFSRFVFVLPAGVLAGVTALSLAPPSTMPLIFEKLIPYHIKTIAVPIAFYSFSDLAMNVIGRPTIRSHGKWFIRSSFCVSYLALLAATTVIVVADKDPHVGYMSSLGLVGLSAVPTLLYTMPGWVRAWRLAFLGVSAVSVVTARRKLSFYEENWNSLIFD